MGKQGKSSLGRALVKDRFGASKGKKKVDSGSMLHTTEIQDGYEWGRLNLQSVTEESSFQEFLSTAQLAGTEFQAEKLNLKLVAIGGAEAITSKESRANVEKKHAESKHLLRVPRRPPWNKEMTADLVQVNEREAFLNWRRDLAILQEKDEFILTPYEKNLEFWRQLWRVLERSQLLVQVLDARNPLLFRCEDLETYAKEVGVRQLLLLLNKADLLSQPQREAWAQYFDQQGIKVAFFSAVLAEEQLKMENAAKRKQEDEENEEQYSSDDESESDDSDSEAGDEMEAGLDEKEPDEIEKPPPETTIEDLRELIQKLDSNVDKTAERLKNIENKILDLVESKPASHLQVTVDCESNIDDGNQQDKTVSENKTDSEKIEEEKPLGEESSSAANNVLDTKKKVSFAPVENKDSVEKPGGSKEESPKSPSCVWGEKNCADVLTREQMIELLKSAKGANDECITVGMVGYPNVGKSSTINSLMTLKKVSVSATPGKTKHFQTLFLSEELVLCDCPGLVLPSFVSTKADMVLHGILPLDQMREYMEAVGLLVEGLGGRRAAERRLGVMLPPAPADDPDLLPPRDLLLAYAYSRGMMTGAGTPDCARAARAILRAACAGKLPLALPPPTVDAETFRKEAYPPLPEEIREETRRDMTPQEKRALKSGDTAEDLDNAFFKKPSLAAHAKGVAGKPSGLPKMGMVNGSATEEASTTGKPWKQINKHCNKKKKEKLRKTFYYLDKH